MLPVALGLAANVQALPHFGVAETGAVPAGATVSEFADTKDVRPCLGSVADGKLEELLACYYKPGERFVYPGPFRLLSEDSLSEFPKDVSREHDVWTNWKVRSVKLVGKESIGKRQFARVSVMTDRGGCTVTGTDTWVNEKGHWRKIWYPDFERALEANNTTERLTAFEFVINEWIRRDPYAIRPMDELEGLLKSGPDLVKFKISPRLPKSDHGNRGQLLRRIQAANPADEMALRSAIANAPDESGALAAFSRVPSDSCVRQTLVLFSIGKLATGKAMLAFAQKHGDHSAAEIESVVFALQGLDEKGTLAAYLDGTRTNKLRQRWEGKGSSEEAGRKAILLASRLAEEKAMGPARDWLKYARRLAPASEFVKSIAEGIEESQQGQ